jgi:hypothetical protein
MIQCDRCGKIGEKDLKVTSVKVVQRQARDIETNEIVLFEKELCQTCEQAWAIRVHRDLMLAHNEDVRILTGAT